MLALGALPDHPVRPYWYFGVKHSESLTDTDFLISAECARPPGLAQWEIVARDDGDCLAKITETTKAARPLGEQESKMTESGSER